MDKKPPPKVMFNFQEEEEVNDAPELVIDDTELIEEAEPEPILKIEEKEKIMEKKERPMQPLFRNRCRPHRCGAIANSICHGISTTHIAYSSVYVQYTRFSKRPVQKQRGSFPCQLI